VQTLIQIQKADRELLTALDRTMAEAARRSGEWLACRPGCTQCCIGPFAITQLDAIRLRDGLSVLELSEPARAAKVRVRAADYVHRIRSSYPGDRETGELWDEDALPSDMDDVPCPALDPETGFCELYKSRPVTCRTFGPATRIGEKSFGACELCYVGATDEAIAQCAVEIDSERREQDILAALEDQGVKGLTIVAFAIHRRR
jgi:Fe-S-cluster containining protein